MLVYRQDMIYNHIDMTSVVIPTILAWGWNDNYPTNPSPAEPGYALPLQTVQIQISWLLHCLSFSMWICIQMVDKVICLDDLEVGVAS